MELFGIILSVPFCFFAALVGAYGLVWLAKLQWARSFFRAVRIVAVITFLLSAVNFVLSIVIGPCKVWELFGDTYATGSIIIFLSAPPSLVFLLAILPNGEASNRSAFQVASITTIICFALVLEQYDRTDNLFGIDGGESPAVACIRDNKSNPSP